MECILQRRWACSWRWLIQRCVTVFLISGLICEIYWITSGHCFLLSRLNHDYKHLWLSQDDLELAIFHDLERRDTFPFLWNFLITLPENRSWDTHLQEANPLSHTAVPFELIGLCVTEFQSEFAPSTSAVILHSCLFHFFPNTNTHLKFCALNNEVAFVDSCCLWVCVCVWVGDHCCLGSSPNFKIGT